MRKRRRAVGGLGRHGQRNRQGHLHQHPLERIAGLHQQAGRPVRLRQRRRPCRPPAPTANPVWAPLDSNLKVYIEYSNEVWNSAFTQAGTQIVGWANQLSQRQVYDYLTNNQNDPLYPGGGANAYNDGAIFTPQFINALNEAGFLGHLQPNAPVQHSGSSPDTSTTCGSQNGYYIYQGWLACPWSRSARPSRRPSTGEGTNRRQRRRRRPAVCGRCASGNTAAVGSRRTPAMWHERDVRVAAPGRLLPLRRRRRLVCRHWDAANAQQSNYYPYGYTDAVFTNCTFATPALGSGNSQAESGQLRLDVQQRDAWRDGRHCGQRQQSGQPRRPHGRTTPSPTGQHADRLSTPRRQHRSPSTSAAAGRTLPCRPAEPRLPRWYRRMG